MEHEQSDSVIGRCPELVLTPQCSERAAQLVAFRDIKNFALQKRCQPEYDVRCNASVRDAAAEEARSRQAHTGEHYQHSTDTDDVTRSRVKIASLRVQHFDHTPSPLGRAMSVICSLPAA
eukprot:6178763-Pleurochrysis_carterae.AAC.1